MNNKTSRSSKANEEHPRSGASREELTRHYSQKLWQLTARLEEVRRQIADATDPQTLARLQNTEGEYAQEASVCVFEAALNVAIDPDPDLWRRLSFVQVGFFRRALERYDALLSGEVEHSHSTDTLLDHRPTLQRWKDFFEKALAIVADLP